MSLWPVLGGYVRGAAGCDVAPRVCDRHLVASNFGGCDYACDAGVHVQEVAHGRLSMGAFVGVDGGGRAWRR